MSDEEKAVGLVIAMISQTILIILLIVVLVMSNNHWSRVCIQRGFAEYNQTTGAWQWKVKPMAEEPTQ